MLLYMCSLYPIFAPPFSSKRDVVKRKGAAILIMKKLNYLAVLFVSFSINLTQSNAAEVYQEEGSPEAQMDQEEEKETAEASKTSIVKRVRDICIGVGISIGVVWIGSATFKACVHGDTFLQAINPIFGGFEKRIKYQFVESAKILDNKNLKEDQKNKKLKSLFRRRPSLFLFVLPALRLGKESLDMPNLEEPEDASYMDVVDMELELLNIFKEQTKKFLQKKREVLFNEFLKSPDKINWALFWDEEFVKPFEQSKMFKRSKAFQKLLEQPQQFLAQQVLKWFYNQLPNFFPKKLTSLLPTSWR